jgi:hypothetical protein
MDAARFDAAYAGREAMDVSTVLLRVFAVLIGLRALTNVFKPLGAGTGLVFFGKLLTGTANTILAPLMGLYMLILAYGMWRQRRFALPMSVAYAIYVAINLMVFPILQTVPEQYGLRGMLLYAAVGLGIPLATVWLLSRRRSALT